MAFQVIQTTVSSTDAPAIRKSFEMLAEMPQPLDAKREVFLSERVMRLVYSRDGVLLFSYTLGADLIHWDVTYVGDPKDYGAGDVGWFMGKRP